MISDLAVLDTAHVPYQTANDSCILIYYIYLLPYIFRTGIDFPHIFSSLKVMATVSSCYLKVATPS